jgi:hypothetical protein
VVAGAPTVTGGMRIEINSGGYRNGPALPPSFLQAFPLAPGEDGVQAPIASVERLMAWQAASRLP